MNTPFSLVLGMTYTYLPFMVLPLYGNLAKMDLRLLEAAADLGRHTPGWRSGRSRCRCPRPASLPGPCWCSFPAWASSSSPNCWAAPETLMIGRVLLGRVLQQQRLADGPRPWAVVMGPAHHRAAGHLQQIPGRIPGGCAMSSRRTSAAVATPGSAAAGCRRAYVFLYLPIVALVMYSRSTIRPCPTSWRGFTLKWYARAVGRPDTETDQRTGGSA